MKSATGFLFLSYITLLISNRTVKPQPPSACRDYIYGSCSCLKSKCKIIPNLEQWCPKTCGICSRTLATPTATITTTVTAITTATTTTITSTTVTYGSHPVHFRSGIQISTSTSITSRKS